MTNFEKWRNSLTINDMTDHFTSMCITDKCPLKENGRPFFFGLFICKKENRERNECRKELEEWANKECKE